MSRFRACGALMALALTTSMVGCGGSEPVTPPEQATAESGQEMMDKLKSLQAGTMNPSGNDPQNAMEKMRSMTKKGR